MASAYHSFAVVLAEIGNVREAGRFRAAQKERTRLIYLDERRIVLSLGYWLWKFTSQYGESLARWSMTCLGVIAFFAIAYSTFDLIAPASGLVDYFYFSVVTFTTLGYGDIHPKGVLGKLGTSVEVAAGFTMFGILLSIISNRFQRL